MASVSLVNIWQQLFLAFFLLHAAVKGACGASMGRWSIICLGALPGVTCGKGVGEPVSHAAAC